MDRPQDVATRETAAFLEHHLPPGASLLEIGCGEGDLARHLRSQGYRVIGLESDRARSVLTLTNGVPTVLAAWPHFESRPFDAIAFTRSLHHIDDLGKSIAQAKALLEPNGVLLIEDFAVHEVTPSVFEWFQGVLRSSTARSLCLPVPDELVTQLNECSDPLALWRERHDHVHPFDSIEAVVREEFAVHHLSTAPYFYRYLVYVLPPTPAAAAFLQSVLEEEQELAAIGSVAALGRRIVGLPRYATGGPS